MFRVSTCNLNPALLKCTQPNTRALHSWKNVKDLLSDKLAVLGRLFAAQCEFIAAQRFRRSSQICSLYSRLYSEKSLRSMVSRFRSRFSSSLGPRPIGFMLATSFFSWENEIISDREMKECACELEMMSLSPAEEPASIAKPVNSASQQNCPESPGDKWELVIAQENMKLWRKSVPNSSLYQYKVYGRFFDIPARVFFSVQVDLEYRKKWDRLVIRLDVVDREDTTGSEVVHWVMHYPYPMYSRDYVYVRRHWVDHDSRTMTIVSRSTTHPEVPESNEYVRVTRYSSQMVIRPHKDFDENGFDYLLTYVDDPRAMFPSPAYNWMASSGVPDFVNKLHSAAKTLHEENRGRSKAENVYAGQSHPGLSKPNQIPAYG